MKRSICVASIIFSIVLSVVFCILNLTGCSSNDYTYTTMEIENELEKENMVIMQEIYQNGQTAVKEIIDIPGEPFSLVCTYDTGDLPLNDWMVTSNKSIGMTVSTKDLPEGYHVYIEHMHADMIIKSTEPQVDGITQDSMDDSDHRIPTKGFPISDTISYHNIFAIEGYTDQFYESWGHLFNGYGSYSTSYERLTEQNLRELGTYAEKLAIVYDIIVIPPDMEEGYVRSVYSEILIPLGEIKTVTRNLFTDEIVEE